MMVGMGAVVLGGGAFLLMSGDGSIFDKPPTIGATEAPIVKISQADFDSVLKVTPTKGRDDARFTVIEFADFQCPLCRKMFATVCKDLGKKIDVKFGFVNYPLEEMHQYALQASLTSQSALEQGKFWEFYAAMFEDVDAVWTDLLVDECATKAGLDLTKVKMYMSNDTNVKAVQALRDRVTSLGVGSTPSFWVHDKQSGKIVQVVGVELYKTLAEAPGMVKIDATKFETPPKS